MERILKNRECKDEWLELVDSVSYYMHPFIYAINLLIPDHEYRFDNDICINDEENKPYIKFVLKTSDKKMYPNKYDDVHTIIRYIDLINVSESCTLASIFICDIIDKYLCPLLKFNYYSN